MSSFVSRKMGFVEKKKSVFIFSIVRWWGSVSISVLKMVCGHQYGNIKVGTHSYCAFLTMVAVFAPDYLGVCPFCWKPSITVCVCIWN